MACLHIFNLPCPSGIATRAERTPGTPHAVRPSGSAFPTPALAGYHRKIRNGGKCAWGLCSATYIRIDQMPRRLSGVRGGVQRVHMNQRRTPAAGDRLPMASPAAFLLRGILRSSVLLPTMQQLHTRMCDELLTPAEHDTRAASDPCHATHSTPAFTYAVGRGRCSGNGAGAGGKGRVRCPRTLAWSSGASRRQQGRPWTASSPCSPAGRMAGQPAAQRQTDERAADERDVRAVYHRASLRDAQDPPFRNATADR